MQFVLTEIYRNTIKLLINPKDFFLKLENANKPLLQVVKSIFYYLIFEILFIMLILNKKFYGLIDLLADKAFIYLQLRYIITFTILLLLQYGIALIFKGNKDIKIHIFITCNLFLIYPLCVLLIDIWIFSFVIFNITLFLIIIYFIFLLYHIMIHALGIKHSTVKVVIITLYGLLIVFTILWILFWLFMGHLP
jgi:hypothetical protein